MFSGFSALNFMPVTKPVNPVRRTWEILAGPHEGSTGELMMLATEQISVHSLPCFMHEVFNALSCLSFRSSPFAHKALHQIQLISLGQLALSNIDQKHTSKCARHGLINVKSKMQLVSRRTDVGTRSLFSRAIRVELCMMLGILEM